MQGRAILTAAPDQDYVGRAPGRLLTSAFKVARAFADQCGEIEQEAELVPDTR